MRVLVVEDNEELVALLTKALSRAGIDADSARTVVDAEASLRTVSYAAVVLDLGLPDADGMTLLDQMRRRRDQTPVLILSALGEVDDRVTGLRAGGDDYLVKPYAFTELLARVTGLNKGASDYLPKPFATEELIARLQALLRRSPGPGGPTLSLGNVSLKTDGRQAEVDGRILSLPAREVDVLEVLLKRNGRVVSHDALQGQVFGSSQDVASNAIEVYIHRLRKLLAEAGANVHIHTIRGAGYLMDVVKTN
jgi:two-component system response regulator TctD